MELETGPVLFATRTVSSARQFLCEGHRLLVSKVQLPRSGSSSHAGNRAELRGPYAAATLIVRGVIPAVRLRAVPAEKAIAIID
jgi:hypothetical protein